ncbi:hypothetical protein SEUCBS140593_010479, partial [Sporothrix eucalyptigena]
KYLSVADWAFNSDAKLEFPFLSAKYCRDFDEAQFYFDGGFEEAAIRNTVIEALNWKLK